MSTPWEGTRRKCILRSEKNQPKFNWHRRQSLQIVVQNPNLPTCIRTLDAFGSIIGVRPCILHPSNYFIVREWLLTAPCDSFNACSNCGPNSFETKTEFFRQMHSDKFSKTIDIFISYRIFLNTIMIKFRRYTIVGSGEIWKERDDILNFFGGSQSHRYCRTTHNKCDSFRIDFFQLQDNCQKTWLFFNSNCKEASFLSPKKLRIKSPLPLFLFYHQ